MSLNRRPTWVRPTGRSEEAEPPEDEDDDDISEGSRSPQNAFDVLMKSRGVPCTMPSGSILTSVKACYTTYEQYGDTYICGLEMFYTDEDEGYPWKTICGRADGKKRSDAIEFGFDEHIIGVEFEADLGEGLKSVTLFTSDPGGRHIVFYVSSKEIDAFEDYGEYVGVHREEGKELGPHSYKHGKMQFICKRGNRVNGMRFKDCVIEKIFEEPIPSGHDERWWEKSMDYTPSVKRRKIDSSKNRGSKKNNAPATSSSKPSVATLSSVQASYRISDYGAFICGLQIAYTGNDERVKWGKVKKRQMSEDMAFDINEHIVGVEFKCSHTGEGLEHLYLYTSHPGNRVISFHATSIGIDSSENFGHYKGYKEKGEELGEKPYGQRGEMDFTCDLGNRVTGMKFKKRKIKSIYQEPIPIGYNERWWEKESVGDDDNKTEKKLEGDEHQESNTFEDRYTTLPVQNISLVRRHEDISFFRPDGTTESKSVDWCLGNDFFQIEEGLWSGPWFYKKYPEAESIHDKRMQLTERIRHLCKNQSSSESNDEPYFGYRFSF